MLNDPRSHEEARSRYEVPSVRRAMKILRVVATADEPLSASELSRILDLPKSSVFRITTTLELERFLERDENDLFRIGPSSFEVGVAYSRHVDLETAFRKVARSLVDSYNETVQLAIPVGTDVLYVGKEESLQPVRLVSKLGMRLPAHVTSLGKALLSCLPEDELHSLYPNDKLTPLTPNSHSSLASLVEDLRGVRERGWAYDNEETAIGLRCVGSPILDHQERPIAAISIAVPVQRAPTKRVTQLGEAVKNAADRISAQMRTR